MIRVLVLSALRKGRALFFSTPPLSIVDHSADHNHCGGVRNGYRYIFLHDTDTPSDGNGLNSLAWLSTTRGSGVSCTRYIPKSGQIYKLMPDATVPWTNGATVLEPIPDNQPGVNEWSLTIELEHARRDKGAASWPLAQVRSCAWQCAEWWGLYGALPILGHTWVQANRDDPRDFPWVIFYRELFARIP